MKRLSPFLAMLGAFDVAVSETRAEVEIQTVALTGDTTPVGNGNKFNAFEVTGFPAPGTADEAFSIFPATTVTSGGGTSVSGVFGGLTGQLQTLFVAGAAAPGTSGAVFTTARMQDMANSVVVNDLGVAALRGFLTGGDTVVGSTDTGIWKGAPGQLQLFVRRGQTVPSPQGNEFYSTLDPPGVGNAGQLVFGATTNIKTRLYAGTAPANVHLVASSDDAAPITIPNRNDPLTISFQGNRPDANNTRINLPGQVAVGATIIGFPVATGSHGVFLSGSGGLQVVAHTAQNKFDNNANSPLSPGSEAPGTGTRGRFTSIGTFELNEGGQVAFRAEFISNENIGHGLWIGVPGSRQLIARTGQASGVGSATFDQIFVPAGGGYLNDAGQVVFRSQLVNPDQSLLQAVFRSSGGSTTPIASQGQNATAAGAGWKFQNFNPPTINEAGQLAFLATLENGAQSDVLSLWLSDPFDNLTFVTRVGAQFTVRPGDTRTVRNIVASRIDDDGQVVFRLEFNPVSGGTFTSGIFIAGLPNATGIDFYWAGVTAVNDNWHTTSPSTNWTDSIGVSTTVPGTAGTEKVFIEDASVRVEDAQVKIGTLTATGTLTIRNRFEITEASTAASLVLDGAASKVVAGDAFTLTKGSRWEAGVISGGIFDGTAATGGLINNAPHPFPAEENIFAITGSGEKTLLDGVLVNKIQLEQRASFTLDNGVIYNDAGATFAVRTAPGSHTTVAANGTSIFYNRGTLEMYPTMFSGGVAVLSLNCRYVSAGAAINFGAFTHVNFGGGSELSGFASINGPLVLLGGPLRPHVVKGNLETHGNGALRLPTNGVMLIESGATLTNALGSGGAPIPADYSIGLFLEGGPLTVNGTLLNSTNSPGAGGFSGGLLFRIHTEDKRVSPVSGTGQFHNVGHALFSHPGAEFAPNPPFGIPIVNRDGGFVEQEGELIVAFNVENLGDETTWVLESFATLRPTTEGLEFRNSGTLRMNTGSHLEMPLNNLNGGMVEATVPEGSRRITRKTTHEDGSMVKVIGGAPLILEGDENVFHDVTLAIEQQSFSNGGLEIRGKTLHINGKTVIHGLNPADPFGGRVTIQTDQIHISPDGLFENRGEVRWLRGDLLSDSVFRNGGVFDDGLVHKMRSGRLDVAGPDRKMLDAALDNLGFSTVQIEDGATLLLGPRAEIYNEGRFILIGQLVSGEDNQQVIGRILNISRQASAREVILGRFIAQGGTHFVRSAFDNQGLVEVNQEGNLIFRGPVAQIDSETKMLTGGSWTADSGTLNFTVGEILGSNAIITIRGTGRIVDFPGPDSGSSFDNRGSLSLKGNAVVRMGGRFDNNGTLEVDATSTFQAGTFNNWKNCIVDGVMSAIDFFLGIGGRLDGRGTLIGNVTAGGTISPGTSPGTLSITGDLTQTDTSRLRIELASAGSYDRLLVTGNANLDGMLVVAKLGGFTPAQTDRFTFLESTQPITGTFWNVFNGRVMAADRSGTFSVSFLNNNTRLELGDFKAGDVIDSDGDGLSDEFEKRYAGDPVAMNPGADSDGDGATNQQEYEAGTDPTDPASTPSAGNLLNISTRMRVGTGENVLIGGMIVTGTAPKKVIIRAIGPSLVNAGVSEALLDPTLELFDGAGVSITSNDNWKDGDRAEIEASTIPPADDREAAIVRTLAPGNYTAIVRGIGGTTGIALVEAYDLSQGVPARLANISSRGFVETVDNVMIGGLIVGGNTTGATRVVVRGLGPSLTAAGIQGALQDPTLDLVNANGAIIQQNDDWKFGQRDEIEAIGIQPSHDAECALVAAIASGNYTAIIRGKNETTGVAVVEVYRLP